MGPDWEWWWSLDLTVATVAKPPPDPVPPGLDSGPDSGDSLASRSSESLIGALHVWTETGEC